MFTNERLHCETMLLLEVRIQQMEQRLLEMELGELGNCFFFQKKKSILHFFNETKVMVDMVKNCGIQKMLRASSMSLLEKVFHFIVVVYDGILLFC